MIDINCDVGEGRNNEHLLMPYINSCNIACGAHAGDTQTMERVVELAIYNNVKIGAHPSYPDKENFGRISMEIHPSELRKTLRNQIKLLEKEVHSHGQSIHHIKPHGALYNDLVKDKNLAVGFLNSLKDYLQSYKLFVPFGSVIAKEAEKRDVIVVYEAFADRNYNDDLSLVSREEDNAVLVNTNEIIKHVSGMVKNGLVTTVSGKKIPITASTICVHSDTANAVEIVKQLHQQFN